MYLPSNLENDPIISTCEKYNSEGNIKNEVVHRKQIEWRITIYKLGIFNPNICVTDLVSHLQKQSHGYYKVFFSICYWDNIFSIKYDVCENIC